MQLQVGDIFDDGYPVEKVERNSEVVPEGRLRSRGEGGGRSQDGS